MLSTRLVWLVGAWLLCVLCAQTALAETYMHSGVYVKLLPGKELCVDYHAYRDPQGDPVLVTLQHRCIDPRLAGIGTTLFGPSGDPSKRGPELPVTDVLDTFGDFSPITFYAEQTGTYKMCFVLPLMKPAMRFEMFFTAANDIVEPPKLEDDAFVLDKPPEMLDYSDRLKMMNVSVETTLDEIRTYQTRRYFFDRTVNSAFYLCLFSVVLNIVLAVGLTIWSERYLEQFYVKQKIS